MRVVLYNLYNMILWSTMMVNNTICVCMYYTRAPIHPFRNVYFLYFLRTDGLSGFGGGNRTILAAWRLCSAAGSGLVM
jgi:hypothetical protein